MKHDLKTWPNPFDAIERGEKTCEVRFDDRKYSVGDTLVLRRYDPESGTYTPNRPPIELLVTHKLDGGQFGIEEGYCVMSIKPASSCGMADNIIRRDELLRLRNKLKKGLHTRTVLDYQIRDLEKTINQ